MFKQIVVATHSGIFHADDVFAMALVRLVLRRRGVKIVTVRTRKESIINDADIVLDVGNIYDPENGEFDHHQWTSTDEAVCHVLRERVDGEMVESKFSKATFGLVWDHYHEDALVHIFNILHLKERRMEGADLSSIDLPAFARKVKDGVDRCLVMGIDASDVGFRRADPMFTTVSQVISGFNPEWYESPTPEDYDAAFERAVEWAEGYLRQQIRREICSVLSRDYGQLAAPIVDRGELVDGELLVLDQFSPWAGVVAKRDYREDLQFVIHPDNGTWMIWQVPVDKSGAFKAGSFIGRRQLPAEWAGKRNEELAELTGVADAVFCHGARFCGGAGSREGAIAMARLALKAQESEPSEQEHNPGEDLGEDLLCSSDTRGTAEYPLDRPERFSRLTYISKEMYAGLVQGYDDDKGPRNKRALRIARYVDDQYDLWAYQHDDRYYLLRSLSK